MNGKGKRRSEKNTKVLKGVNTINRGVRDKQGRERVYERVVGAMEEHIFTFRGVKEKEIRRKPRKKHKRGHADWKLQKS